MINNRRTGWTPAIISNMTERRNRYETLTRISQCAVQGALRNARYVVSGPDAIREIMVDPRVAVMAGGCRESLPSRDSCVDVSPFRMRRETSSRDGCRAVSGHLDRAGLPK